MDLSDFFSEDYVSARERFRAVSAELGAKLFSLPIPKTGPDRESLAIDIALFGSNKASKVLLHFSGVHGVEGFAGSAIQIRILEKLKPKELVDSAVVFIHGVNPYGMAWLRRVNGENVDLNRNSINRGKKRLAEKAYGKLDRSLNPPSAPGTHLWDLQLSPLFFNLFRHGFSYMQQTIAEGQYCFPKGLFYGGASLQLELEAVQQWLSRNFNAAQKVYVIDIHTGLGSFGDETLYVDGSMSDEELGNLQKATQSVLTRGTRDGKKTYDANGGFVHCIKAAFPQAQVNFIIQEFGTLSALVVLLVLRQENRWHHFGRGDIHHPAKRWMKDAFCPTDMTWRKKVLASGVQLFSRLHKQLEKTVPNEAKDPAKTGKPHHFRSSSLGIAESREHPHHDH